VTPCCGNILRTSSPAISHAGHLLDLGICPDCNLNLADEKKRLKGRELQARLWFIRNAKNFGGRWQWNANAAAIAFVEIGEAQNG
jgi:hypothetical protein